MTTQEFSFYNKGIKKQDVVKNINVFAEKYQCYSDSEAPLKEDISEAELQEIFKVLKDCLLDAYFLAFSGEQKALINHILKCLNEDLKDYLPTIKKAALSRDKNDWEKMKTVMIEAFNEY